MLRIEDTSLKPPRSPARLECSFTIRKLRLLIGYTVSPQFATSCVDSKNNRLQLRGQLRSCTAFPLSSGASPKHPESAKATSAPPECQSMKLTLRLCSWSALHLISGVATRFVAVKREAGSSPALPPQRYVREDRYPLCSVVEHGKADL